MNIQFATKSRAMFLSKPVNPDACISEASQIMYQQRMGSLVCSPLSHRR